MTEEAPTRIHEQDFCSEVAKWADEIFRSDPSSPFSSARIEGLGSGAQRRKKKDLRFYDRGGKVALTGEVKLPSSVEGRTPYDSKLIEDAQAKADNANARYFFTWNVNTFVLWDRYRQNVPLLERCVREWPAGRVFRGAEEVGRPENLEYLRRRFIPSLMADLSAIYAGRRADWGMAPDDLFIRLLESHLQPPVELTRTYLADRAEKSRSFDRQLQEWMAEQSWQFVRRPAEAWAEALERAARTIVYVLANRLIFYQSLRARFRDLPRLRLPSRVKTAGEAYEALQQAFENAVRRSGDYEPLFYPREKQDWAGPLVFEHPGALDAWRGALRGIEAYDFSHISSDVVGRIFQRLISPDERHRWGQHFTGDDVVDLINAFCIRNADAAVLDPACGSGSFLVRAYYREHHLNPRKPHLALLSELFGCDIALYPSHLATLNLAAREINDEANYPRIARRDFFDIGPDKPFCSLPDGDGVREVTLPLLDAVVGNPPYVRQERVGSEGKAKMAKTVADRWPGLKLSGRSDAHCYFWPAAAYFLREGGHFGFLTSSSWLDVEYGFALQRWILENFRIIAICESEAEPWFEDARVKTCVTILQRCTDRRARLATRVKFVQFKRPLAAIIGEPPDGGARFGALDALRERIDSASQDTENGYLRIIVKPQRELWEEGVRAARLLRGAADQQTNGAENEEDDEGEPRAEAFELGDSNGYAAGKWGRYVRAPDFYFEVMRRFGSRFVPLGEIADIRFGVKSGCDAFFMPHDITRWALEKFRANADFRKRYGLDRAPAERGEIKIVRAGDGSEHPIEAEYLKPEVHSLMTIDRPVVRAGDVDRLVLLVGEALGELKGTWVARYLKYGETQTFASAKSKAVPVPKRSTVAARNPWYDLTKLVKPGFAFWPKATQYRHVAVINPEPLIANCRLYDIGKKESVPIDSECLTAVLNSTLVALWRHYYGRYTGTEGSLDTMIIDLALMEVPDPRDVPPEVAERLRTAFEQLCRRPIGRLVEEELMDCHSPEHARIIASGPLRLPDELRQPDRRALDEAVFELLGASEPGDRSKLVDRLYAETALHFRKIRVVEIQKQEQRSKTGARRLTADELAADAWDAVDLPDLRPLAEWLSEEPGPKEVFAVPDGDAPNLASSSDMYDRNAVFFGKGRGATRIVCGSRDQAELLARLVTLGLRESVSLPKRQEDCRECRDRLEARLERARAEFEDLAESRGGNDKARAEIAELLMHWFVHGRERRGTGAERQKA